jgi:hypothetical protein
VTEAWRVQLMARMPRLVVPGYRKGHLWQERFHSCVMDEHYLLAKVRYTELNPIRARLCSCPADWPWSSARAHLNARDDSVATERPAGDEQFIARIGSQ